MNNEEDGAVEIECLLGAAVGTDDVLNLVSVWVLKAQAAHAKPHPVSVLGTEAIHDGDRLALQLQHWINNDKHNNAHHNYLLEEMLSCQGIETTMREIYPLFSFPSPGSPFPLAFTFLYLPFSPLPPFPAPVLPPLRSKTR